MLWWRYVARELGPRIVVALAALVGLYLAFDLADQGRRAAQSVGWAAVLSATLLRLPLIAVQVLPAALLGAMALWLGGLRRSGELEAMRVAGASVRRLAAPLLAAGALCGAASFVTLERFVPDCEQGADRLLGQRRSPLTGLGRASGWIRRGRWMFEQGGDGTVLALELDEHGHARRRVVGTIAAGADALVHARTIALGARLGRARHLPRLAIPGLQAAIALWHAPRAEALSWSALSALIDARAQAGQRRPAEALVLHAKVTYPLVNIVLALFCVGLALGGRRRRSGSELLRAALALLALWITLALSWWLARADLVSAAAASWGALVLAALAAATFVARRAAKG